MGTTELDTEAWDAYSNLRLIDVNNEIPNTDESCPLAHMHRLARLLGRVRPKTRRVFLCQLSVLTAIKNAGGRIGLHEWNSLIDLSGKGWRKMRVQDFETALTIFKDMNIGASPGMTLAKRMDEDDESGSHDDPAIPIPGDIYTHTILISLAARTLDPNALRQATVLLERSGLEPNRVTYIAMLHYYTHTHQLSGVRSTLIKMRQQGLEIGLDGLNAILWAYGNNNRVDIVMMIYRVLRHNVVPERHVGEDDIESVVALLRDEELISFHPAMKPNEITFTIVIQVMAYHGNLLATLNVFMDMLASPNVEMGAPLVLDENGILAPTTYSPTVHVFRAIFLGFYRHGFRPSQEGTLKAIIQAANPPGQPNWSLSNLQSIYDAFMALPGRIHITQAVVYYIITSFKKASGNDEDLLRKVWLQLEERFNGPWGEPGSRLYEMRMTLFPGDTTVFERKRLRWDPEAGPDSPPHLTKGPDEP